MQKKMKESVSLAVRLPGYLADEVKGQAERQEITPGERLRQIVTDYFHLIIDEDIYPLRHQAREVAHKLRQQGQKVSITGGKGYWRIVRQNGEKE